MKQILICDAKRQRVRRDLKCWRRRSAATGSACPGVGLALGRKGQTCDMFVLKEADKTLARQLCFFTSLDPNKARASCIRYLKPQERGAERL